MWNYVGILRSDKMLAYAEERINVIHSEINEFYHTHHINMDLLELRNIIDVANIIISSAMREKKVVDYIIIKTILIQRSKFNKSTKLINLIKTFI